MYECLNPDDPEVFEDGLPDSSNDGDGLDETSGEVNDNDSDEDEGDESFVPTSSDSELDDKNEDDENENVIEDDEDDVEEVFIKGLHRPITSIGHESKDDF